MLPSVRAITEMTMMRFGTWDAHHVVLNVLHPIGTYILGGARPVVPLWPKVGRWCYNGSVVLGTNPIISARYTAKDVSPWKYFKRAMSWGPCHLVTQIKLLVEKATVVFVDIYCWASIFQYNEWRKLTFLSKGDVHVFRIFHRICGKILFDEW